MVGLAKAPAGDSHSVGASSLPGCQLSNCCCCMHGGNCTLPSACGFQAAEMLIGMDLMQNDRVSLIFGFY